MTVTKNNVRDLIESYLKDNKIKYTTNYEGYSKDDKKR
jgi:hypothetical protein